LILLPGSFPPSSILQTRQFTFCNEDRDSTFGYPARYRYCVNSFTPDFGPFLSAMPSVTFRAEACCTLAFSDRLTVEQVQRMFGHPAGMTGAFQRIALEILMESRDGLVNSQIQSSIFNSGRVYKVASKSFMITISTWYPFRHFHFPSPPSTAGSSTLPNAQSLLLSLKTAPPLAVILTTGLISCIALLQCRLL
jgi:hypothetical protein